MKRTHTLRDPHPNLAFPAGFYSALANTAAGVIYALVLMGALVAEQMTWPPPMWLQLFGGAISLIMCPVLVVMMAAVHARTSAHRHVLSLSALGFTLLFALAVSINRFSQLGVVRQAQLAGTTDSIHWFEAYGDFSILLGMEYLGWAWFLGLALLCAAPLFSGGRLERWIRGLMLLYAAMALVSAVGFLLGTWLSLIGFAAWGFVLVIITGLLAVYFRRGHNDG